MRVAAQIEISAPREVVWEWITDPRRYLHFMSGVTRWEICSDEPTGCGARYRTLMRVGSAEMQDALSELQEERTLPVVG